MAVNRRVIGYLIPIVLLSAQQVITRQSQCQTVLLQEGTAELHIPHIFHLIHGSMGNTGSESKEEMIFAFTVNSP